MSSEVIRLRRPRVRAERVAFFRYGEIRGRIVLTNDAGEWHLLSRADFELFLAGELDEAHPEHAALQRKGFLRGGLDVEALATTVQRRNRHLGVGPHLHIVIATLRCNQSCKYCHASRVSHERDDADMSLETAKKVVDYAMQTSSPYVNFEFQGGEPTFNFPVVQFIVEYSREKNRLEQKELEHSLVTSMSAMTEERANWLIDNDVLVCTSLDGPAELHDWNRPFSKGSSYEEVIRWLRYFNDRYFELGRDPRLWHVDALATTTRKTFDHWKELIDLYVELGIRSIHLRPLNPFGFAVATWKSVGYSVHEYLDFYARSLDYIIDLNRQGVELIEGTAAIFLNKLLTADDPNFVDILSPCGAGTGQVAYDFDGRIYTCDEARMVAAMGDDEFVLGEVGSTTMDEMLQHPTVRSLAVASLQDSLPACHTCWVRPFCGVCPMHNHMTGGDLFGQRPNSSKCREYFTIASLLVERLMHDTDGSLETMFRRWFVRRPRTRSECAEG